MPNEAAPHSVASIWSRVGVLTRSLGCSFWGVGWSFVTVISLFFIGTYSVASFDVKKAKAEAKAKVDKFRFSRRNLYKSADFVAFFLAFAY